MKLLDNATATGTATLVERSGLYAFAVVGTFDGSTITLQRLGPDDSTWLDCGSDVTFTSAGQGLVNLPGGMYRAEVDGGSSPTGLYANLERAD